MFSMDVFITAKSPGSTCSMASRISASVIPDIVRTELRPVEPAGILKQRLVSRSFTSSTMAWTVSV